MSQTRTKEGLREVSKASLTIPARKLEQSRVLEKVASRRKSFKSIKQRSLRGRQLSAIRKEKAVRSTFAPFPHI